MSRRLRPLLVIVSAIVLTSVVAACGSPTAPTGGRPPLGIRADGADTTTPPDTTGRQYPTQPWY